MKSLASHLAVVSGMALLAWPSLAATNLLVEAEGFAVKGGWVVDPQFVQQMGSPFLLAHGGGKPVADASTSVAFPEPGPYRVWVRTRNWVAPDTDAPGQFKLRVDGVELAPVFGTQSGTWQWQDGGTVQVAGTNVQVALHDLTGFDGRCDAIAFIKGSDVPPPDDGPSLAAWRASVSGEPTDPPQTNSFDCVVVGGGMAGCCATLAAGRSGVRVALIHDRPVFGGNSSGEIRVATRGEVRHHIVDELRTRTGAANRDDMSGEEAARLQKLLAETNLTLYMPWRAYGVGTNSSGRIAYVDARQISTGERRRFAARTFIDCTGDAWIGYWAGADYRMGREAASEFGESRAPATADKMTMGNSLMWSTTNTGSAVAFPSMPLSMAWATNVSGSRADTGGDWNWEYGLSLDTIQDAEQIRDYLLRAIYGNFYNAKQNPANANLDFSFLPYIAGKRESRRLMGDYIVTQPDITNGVYFPDAVGTATWGIDLHYPSSPGYLATSVSTAVARWYYPFRSLYSRNVPNLMMAGRCLSVSHVGLGSPRVQNTTGQMGVAVGCAAAICKQYGIEPRDIYRNPDRTLELQARITGAWPNPPGIIVDNADASGVVIQGAWTSSTSNAGYYGPNYIHDGNTGKGQKLVSFHPVLPQAGNYEVLLRWTSSANRATNVPVTIVAQSNKPPTLVLVNEQTNGGAWFSLGTYKFDPAAAQVIVANSNTTLYVIADAVQFSAVPDPNARFNMKTVLDAMPSQTVLSWPSTTNHTYRIEVSEDLTNFRTYLDNVDATPPLNTQIVLSTNARQFFRVVAE
jgi:hypothetical protein